MLEVASLVVTIVAIILEGGTILAGLWKKLKQSFSNSQKRLRESPRYLVEAALTPILQQDLALRREAEAFYAAGRVSQRSRSQWEVWGAEDDVEWA